MIAKTIMEKRNDKIIALIGDLLNDSEDVKSLVLQLKHLRVKWQYFEDINDDMQLKSVVLILNEKCKYGSDANLFIQCAIFKRIPMIVIYTDMTDNKEIHDSICFTNNAIKLWSKIPAFDKERYVVATVHIPLSDLRQIIHSNDFIRGTMLDPSDYYLLK